MSKRNGWILIAISLVAGFAMFSVPGALTLAAIAAGLVFWLGRVQRGKTEADVNARLAAFMEAQAKTGSAPAVVVVKPPREKPAAAPSRQEVAARSVKLALAAKESPLAVALLRELDAEAASIGLDAPSMERLSVVALEHGEFFVAACLQEAAASSDAALAQKKLVEIAGRALEAGRAKMARRLYERLLERHPASSYESVARAGLKRSLASGTVTSPAVTSRDTSAPG